MKEEFDRLADGVNTSTTSLVSPPPDSSFSRYS